MHYVTKYVLIYFIFCVDVGPTETITHMTRNNEKVIHAW